MFAHMPDPRFFSNVRVRKLPVLGTSLQSDFLHVAGVNPAHTDCSYGLMKFSVSPCCCFLKTDNTAYGNVQRD